MKELEDVKTVYDLVTRSELIDKVLGELRFDGSREDTMEAGRRHDQLLLHICEAVEASLKASDVWYNTMGFVGDSTLDLSSLSHNACHLVFENCVPAGIGLKLALEAYDDAVELLNSYAGVMFACGVAFTLEAQRAAQHLYSIGAEDNVPPPSDEDALRAIDELETNDADGPVRFDELYASGDIDDVMLEHDDADDDDLPF